MRQKIQYEIGVCLATMMNLGSSMPEYQWKIRKKKKIIIWKRK